jgi:hypothetical protein
MRAHNMHDSRDSNFDRINPPLGNRPLGVGANSHRLESEPELKYNLSWCSNYSNHQTNTLERGRCPDTVSLSSGRADSLTALTAGVQAMTLPTAPAGQSDAHGWTCARMPGRGLGISRRTQRCNNNVLTDVIACGNYAALEMQSADGRKRRSGPRCPLRAATFCTNLRKGRAQLAAEALSARARAGRLPCSQGRPVPAGRAMTATAPERFADARCEPSVRSWRTGNTTKTPAGAQMVNLEGLPYPRALRVG